VVELVEHISRQPDHALALLVDLVLKANIAERERLLAMASNAAWVMAILIIPSLGLAVPRRLCGSLTQVVLIPAILADAELALDA
jgi:hypothetical protein